VQTVIAVVLSSNLALAEAPGNVLVTREASRLPKDSVANVSQILTLDRDHLTERSHRLPPRTMAAIDAGLRLVLEL
jgi:mRNA interferase MazF